MSDDNTEATTASSESCVTLPVGRLTLMVTMALEEALYPKCSRVSTGPFRTETRPLRCTRPSAQAEKSSTENFSPTGSRYATGIMRSWAPSTPRALSKSYPWKIAETPRL